MDFWEIPLLIQPSFGVTSVEVTIICRDFPLYNRRNAAISRGDSGLHLPINNAIRWQGLEILRHTARLPSRPRCFVPPHDTKRKTQIPRFFAEKQKPCFGRRSSRFLWAFWNGDFSGRISNLGGESGVFLYSNMVGFFLENCWLIYHFWSNFRKVITAHGKLGYWEILGGDTPNLKLNGPIILTYHVFFR